MSDIQKHPCKIFELCNIEQVKFEETLSSLLTNNSQTPLNELSYFCRRIIRDALSNSISTYRRTLVEYDFCNGRESQPRSVAEVTFYSEIRGMGDIRAYYPVINKFVEFLFSNSGKVVAEHYADNLNFSALNKPLLPLALDSDVELQPCEHPCFDAGYIEKVQELTYKKYVNSDTGPETFEKVTVCPLEELFGLSQKIALYRAVFLVDAYIVMSRGDFSDIDKLGLISRLALRCSAAQSSQFMIIKEFFRQYDDQTYKKNQSSYVGKLKTTESDKELVYDAIEKALRSGKILDNLTNGMLYQYYVGVKQNGQKPTKKTISNHLKKYKESR